MQQEIALLEQMQVTADGMVVAAEAGDWDSLTALEKELAALRRTLTHFKDLPPLSTEELARKQQLIEAMLASFISVQACVLPWMESTRKLLSGNARDRAVKAAYGQPTG